MRKAPLILTIATAGLLLSACGETPDYCSRDLDAPTEAAAQATREGYEVEKELSVRISGETKTFECVVAVEGEGPAHWHQSADV